MRAILTNLGSVGDVQPLFALAAELRRAGHEAVLALAPFYRARVEQLGFGWTRLGPDLDLREIDRRDAARLVAGEDPLAVMGGALDLLAALLPALLADLTAACRGADLLVGGHLQPAAQIHHELTGIPFVSVQVNHFGGRRAPAERAAVAAVINPFRARHGLAPLADPLHGDANSPQLALYAVSRHLGFALPAGAPAHHHLTGFFFLDEEEFRPTAELADFLAAGEPPVVISFSSMTHADPAAATALLVTAVRAAGRRAVLQQGWSGLATGLELPPEVLAVGFVPHAWLFPRASCVVHHGGAQTSAAVLRAGVPSVVVPHVRDQPVWAALLQGLGCAPPPLPAAELSAARLAAVLAAVPADVRLARRAAEVGRLVQAEGGVVRARRLLEDLLARLDGDAAPDGGERRSRYLESRRALRQGSVVGPAGGAKLEAQAPDLAPPCSDFERPPAGLTTRTPTETSTEPGGNPRGGDGAERI